MADKCGAMPDYNLHSCNGDSKAISYLEAVSTRPNQSMNVVMTVAVRTPQDSGGKGGPMYHRDTNSQRTSQGNVDEGESLPQVPLALLGPAVTMSERSDLVGLLEII